MGTVVSYLHLVSYYLSVRLLVRLDHILVDNGYSQWNLSLCILIILVDRITHQN